MQKEVTVVICEHLPQTKIRQLLKTKSFKQYVKPEWIYDSVKYNTLQPIVKYQLNKLKGEKSKKLSDLFNTSSSSASSNRNYFFFAFRTPFFFGNLTQK